MKKKKGVVCIIWIVFILMMGACEKETAKQIIIEVEEVNKNPTVEFVGLYNDVLIEKDTLLRILFLPLDIDGKIDKVEIYINGDLVESFISSPYQYDWPITIVEDIGLYLIKAIAYDDKGAQGVDSISLKIQDYRTKFCGDFYFKVIKESWMIDQPTIYDTSYYGGVLRFYDIVDSDNDVFSGDDSDENPNRKVAIQFKSNLLLTSLIDEHGILIPKTGYHYGHHGNFVQLDTIVFFVGGFGGLGGGYNFEVHGIRE